MLQDVAQLCGFGVRLRSWRLGDDIVDRPLFDRDDSLAAGAPLEDPLGLVDADAVKPRREAGVPSEAVDAAPRAQKRLLRRLFGVGFRVAEAQHDRIQPIGVVTNQHLVSRLVARLSTQHERLFLSLL